MNQHDKAISDLRAKLAALLVLKFALVAAVAWLFAWGTVVLVLRAAAGVDRLWLLWGMAGLGPAVCAAALVARGRVPAASAVRAMLDGKSRAGGLLMACEEVEVGSWRGRLPATAAVAVRLRGTKIWALLAAGAAFVLLGFAVPDSFATMRGQPLQVGNEVGKLHEQIETLKQEEIIDLDKATALQEKLDQIEANASGEDPVKTWEALDHLESEAAKVAKEAAEEAISQTEKLTKAQALAEGLIKEFAKMDLKTATAAMKEMAEMAKQAAEDNKALEEKLSEQLKEACENSSLTKEQLQEIAEALKECKGNISDMLSKLSKAGLIDLDAVELAEKLGDFDCEGLADFLEENCPGGLPGDAAGDKPGGMSVAEAVAAWCNGRPGRGGINRGRGDAAMTWTEGTDAEGAKFKEQVLPPASLAALKDSKLVAISTGTPEAGKAGSDGGKGALKGAAAGAGAAHTHTILPRHRGAVGRYFERKDNR